MRLNINEAMNDKNDEKFNGNLPKGEIINRYFDILYGIINKATHYQLKPFEIIEGIRYGKAPKDIKQLLVI